MTNTDPFQNIFPDLLENGAQEVGDLIGHGLEVQDESVKSGTLSEVYAPPKKKFGAAGFDIKGGEKGAVHLLFDLDLAIELAGRLIMLPADEIAAAKKKGELDGELLDAFSEIANIISGVLNSTIQPAFPGKKIHFLRGSLETYAPKTGKLPVPEGPGTCFSCTLALDGKKIGGVQYLLPHKMVVDEAQPEAEAAVSEKPDSVKPGEAQPAAGRQKAEKLEAEEEDLLLASEMVPEDDGENEAAVADSVDSPAPGGLDPETVDRILIDSLVPSREELEALLGESVEFIEQETRSAQREDLLARTRGKQVLTTIRASGDKEGRCFMLLPLKDAIYFGGVLLMMPPESITQTVKQGKFEGEIADAFGEIANILVGCYSNEFKNAFSFKLALKKETVETLVASQVDPAGEHPFPAGNYRMLSARIQMGDKTYGPLELIFSSDLLGLASSEAPAEAVVEKKKAVASSQKTGPGQKNDTVAEAGLKRSESRIISIISDDPSQLELVEEGLADEDIELARLTMDEDLKHSLARENICCVFLVIGKVNEQGLAKTIKVRSAMNKGSPLIVAGPQWTRSMVLKARKYGATDILITPAEREVIRKKYRKYL